MLLKILQNFWKFPRNSQNLAKFWEIKSCKILQICLQEDDFLEDFEKCWKMRLWTRKSALIQPRTSLGKSDCVVARVILLRASSSPGLTPRDRRLSKKHCCLQNEDLTWADVDYAPHRLVEMICYGRMKLWTWADQPFSAMNSAGLMDWLAVVNYLIELSNWQTSSATFNDGIIAIIGL